MPEKTHLDDPEIEELRRSIKENGLERAVQLMGVTQRGLARRAIREGLQLLLEQRKRAAEGAVQQPASYEKREAFDPNKADGYAQKDGKTVLVRPNRGDQSGWQP